MLISYRWAHNLLMWAFVSIFLSCPAKVTIFARYFGQPEFLKYQHMLFKKNLLDDYELVVVDESNKQAISTAIQHECNMYGVRYIRIPRSAFASPKLPIKDSYVTIDNPSFECAVAIQYIYDNFVVPSEDICVILDNDVFLLAPFSVEKYMGGSAFAYVRDIKGQVPHDVYYMRSNLLLFNPRAMPQKERLDFNLGAIKGTRTDTGGYTYFYLRDYQQLGKTMAHHFLYETPSLLKRQFVEHCPLLFTSTTWQSHYLIDKDLFLHIRMGSNWSKDPNYSRMMGEVCYFLDRLI